MNVLMLTPSYAPAAGGVETHVRALAGNLAARGHRVRIVTQVPECFGQEEPEPGVEEQAHAPEPEPPGPDLSVARLDFKPRSRISMGHGPAVMITQLGSVADADLVHCHDVATLVRWYSLLRIAMPRKPVFITFHGYEGFPIPRAALIKRRIARRATRGAINIGSYLEKWYRFGADRTLAGAVSAPVAVAPPEPGGGGVFVGRLSPVNSVSGYLDALAALKRARGDLPPVEFLGPGGMDPRWVKAIHDQSLPVTTGPAVADPMPRIEEAGFVFAGGLLSVIESMACMRPVFALALNPLRLDYYASIPDAAGLMTVCPTPESLAAELGRYLDEPEPYLEKAGRARDWALTQTWDKVADCYLGLWEEKL